MFKFEAQKMGDGSISNDYRVRLERNLEKLRSSLGEANENNKSKQFLVMAAVIASILGNITSSFR